MAQDYSPVSNYSPHLHDPIPNEGDFHFNQSPSLRRNVREDIQEQERVAAWAEEKLSESGEEGGIASINQDDTAPWVKDLFEFVEKLERKLNTMNDIVDFELSNANSLCAWWRSHDPDKLRWLLLQVTKCKYSIHQIIQEKLLDEVKGLMAHLGNLYEYLELTPVLPKTEQEKAKKYIKSTNKHLKEFYEKTLSHRLQVQLKRTENLLIASRRSADALYQENRVILKEKEHFKQKSETLEIENSQLRQHIQRQDKHIEKIDLNHREDYQRLNGQMQNMASEHIQEINQLKETHGAQLEEVNRNYKFMQTQMATLLAERASPPSPVTQEPGALAENPHHLMNQLPSNAEEEPTLDDSISQINANHFS